MKKTTLMIALALVLSTTALADKIGKFDSNEAFTTFSLTKTLNDELVKETQKIENEIKVKEVALEKEQVSLQAKGDKLTEAEKNKFQEKLEQLNQFVNEANEKINRKQYEGMKKITDIMDKSVEEVAKEGKYTLILEKATVKFGAEDVTKKVITKMETKKK